MFCVYLNFVLDNGHTKYFKSWLSIVPFVENTRAKLPNKCLTLFITQELIINNYYSILIN